MDFRQPNGAKIELTWRGDEFLGWYEDPDGSLVIYDKKQKGFCYANWTDDGPVSTGTLVGDSVSSLRLTKRARGADIPVKMKEKARTLREERMEYLGRLEFTKPVPEIPELSVLPVKPDLPERPPRPPLSLYAEPSLPKVPVVNTAENLKRTVLMINIRWEDESEIPWTPLTKQQIHDMMFKQSPRSVNDYFRELFGKQEDIILPAPVSNRKGEIQGVVEVTLSGSQDSSTIERAMAAAAQIVNFSAYDKDSDGILGVRDLVIGFVVHGSPYPGGAGSACGVYSGVSFDTAWFHVTSVWIINRHMSIGLAAHEMGHAGYGFHDTYDYGLGYGDGQCYGLGNWSLMAHGDSNSQRGDVDPGASPAYVDAYNLVACNIVRPGVLNETTMNLVASSIARPEALRPEVLIPGMPKPGVQIETIGSIRLNSHLDIYKVTNNVKRSQYFLLQQRKFGSTFNYDRGVFFCADYTQYENTLLNKGGLLIYHVDGAIDPGRINDKNSHLYVSVEEAHGGMQHLQQLAGLCGSQVVSLGNGGDLGDLWGVNKTSFSFTMDPSSGLYSPFTPDTTPPNQNTESGIMITNIAWNSSGGYTTLDVVQQFGTIAPVDITQSFSDPVFKAHVYRLIGKSEPQRILDYDVDYITELRLYNKNIRSLSGIEHFISLTYLDCSNNLLETLDLSHNTALKWINCINNQLTSLNVTNCAELLSLDCYANQLSALDLARSTKLTRLWCHFNCISSLDLSRNTKLAELYCSANEMRSLDVSGNTALKYIECNGNCLSSLDVSNNKTITKLVCSSNELTSLGVSNCTAMTYIHCTHNRLTLLNVTGLNKLTFLDCSFNYLPNESSVFGTAITWDGVNFSFHPQNS